MKSNKIVKGLSILAIASLSTGVFANPSCNKNTISGTFRFEEQNRMGEVWLKSNGTYMVTEISIVNGVLFPVSAETGTFQFIKGCAALLTPDHQDDFNPETQQKRSYPILFSNTVVVNGKRVPNAGVWQGGSMFRRLEK